MSMDGQHVLRAAFNGLFLRPLMWMLFAGLLAGCRITDHSERDGEVTADGLNFPVSGYEDVDRDALPALTFDSVSIDMGRVIQGAKVTRSYRFENTGGGALIISDVRGSCGCTVARTWPREPVAPGSGGTIEVVFDSEGRTGRQNKTVTVVANTSPPSTVLTLSGEVVGPKPAE